MFNSTEHEISTAHKRLKYRQTKKCIALSLSDVVLISCSAELSMEKV